MPFSAGYAPVTIAAVAAGVIEGKIVVDKDIAGFLIYCRACGR